MSFKQGWYVLYTRPKHERKVIQALEKQQILLYCPTTKVARKWHDRVKQLTMPLFPSYIFVYLENMENYYRSRDVDGALSYVRFGKELARVSDKVLNDLRFMVDNGRDFEVAENLFEAGQELTITHGILSNFSCEMVEYKNKLKAMVRISILNRVVMADIPLQYLEHEIPQKQFN